MKETLRQAALELGFDACRFTAATAPEHARKLEQWLAEGRHGEMAYLQRNAHKRTDPQQVLSNARTIIVLAAGYDHGNFAEEHAGQKSEASLTREPENLLTRASDPLSPSEGERAGERGNLRGVIARYARYADYHDVLRPPLEKLSARVNQLGGPETRSLWYIDTGPLLERDLAQRAGIGFAGKHTNLISRQLGNWFFLSEIITTLEVEPDRPEKNRCGRCTRCLTACPTGAITAPFELDARLCISYLTIELKGSIPVELRSALGNRIYGCDDCLAACPWNRFARAGKLMREQMRDDLQLPDLLALLALDDAAFKQRFAGTPMLRTRRRGLLRNVCVALGNTGDATALPALERAARDHEPLIAEHARWAIEQIVRREN